MAKTQKDRVYHPSKLFVDQLQGMLDFVTQRGVQLTEVSLDELRAMLEAQRSQDAQVSNERTRHKDAMLGLSRAQAQRHARFMQMLGALRAHFRGDADSLTILNGLKPARKRSELGKVNSKAERELARVARAKALLEKAQQSLAKAQELVSRREAIVTNAGQTAPPTTPAPGGPQGDGGHSTTGGA